jgi:glycosyltransferase involved in cell wall biosynthesis
MVVHGPFPEGQPPRVVREVKAAVEAGFAVDVIATRRTGEPPVQHVNRAVVRRLPVSHQRGVGVARMLIEYGGFTLGASAVLMLRSIRRPYDVIQIHNPPDFLVLAGVGPRILGTKILFDVHDLSPDMFDMRFSGRAMARFAIGILRRIERLALRASDHVITVHEPYRSELIDRGAAKDRTHVVMNAIDEDVVAEVMRRDVVISLDSKFRVVYHGTVTPHYGLDLLLDAFACVREEVRGARLEIIGEGDAIPRLRERVHELQLEDAVSLEGIGLPHVDVLTRIRGASAGVVANLPIGLNRFALSTKLLEYCALEIPAVVADLPTLRGHFAEDEVKFFRAGECHSLAKALLEIAADPAGAAVMASRARRRLDDYSWAANKRRYISLLRQMASTQGGNGSSS